MVSTIVGWEQPQGTRRGSPNARSAWLTHLGRTGNVGRMKPEGVGGGSQAGPRMPQRPAGGPAPRTAKARVRRSWKEPATADILEQAPRMIHRGPRRAGLPRAGAKGPCRRRPGAHGPEAGSQPSPPRGPEGSGANREPRGAGRAGARGGSEPRTHRGSRLLAPWPFLASLTPIQSVFLKRVF